MNDIAPPDHNMAPLARGDEITSFLAETQAPLVRRRDELLGAAARVPVLPLDAEDAEAEKSVTEYLRQIAACSKAADGARVAAKEPYLEGGRRVDGFFKGIMDPLAALDRNVRPRLTAYKDAVEKRARAVREAAAAAARAEEDRKRREAEEAARMAREAEERARGPKTLDKAIEAEAAAVAAAAAEAEAANARALAEQAAAISAADLTRSRSDYGAVSSLQRFVAFRDMDRAALDLEALRTFIPDAALETAVRGYIKANSDAIKASLDGGAKHELRGVTFFLDSRTTVR